MSENIVETNNNASKLRFIADGGEVFGDWVGTTLGGYTNDGDTKFTPAAPVFKNIEKFKKLRFEGFGEGWKRTKLGDVAICLNNKRVPLNSQERASISGDIPYYGSTSIQGYIDKFLFDEDLVLLAEDAAPFHEYSTKAIAQHVKGKSWVNNHAHVLRAKENTAFLFYSLVHKNITKFVSSKTRGKLNQGEMVKVPISLPSLPEQELIANFLSTLDEEISLVEDRVSLLREQKRGFAQQLFGGGLRFKREDGSDFPDWVEVRLGDVVKRGTVTLGRGNVISKTDINNNHGSYPIYSSSALNNGKMGEYGNYMFEDERITWSVDGGGKFFYRHAHKYSVTNVCGWMKVNDYGTLNTKYLYYILDRVWSTFKFDYSNKAHPSTISSLYNILLPSLPEQELIANFLSTIDEEIEATQSKLDILKQQKQAYLQKLLP